MTLAFHRHHPGGMDENSPAFQRWDPGQKVPSPEGTAENRYASRPFGTYPVGCAHPALKRWAIFMCPSGTRQSFVLPVVPGAETLMRLDEDAYAARCCQPWSTDVCRLDSL